MAGGALPGRGDDGDDGGEDSEGGGGGNVVVVVAVVVAVVVVVVVGVVLVVVVGFFFLGGMSLALSSGGRSTASGVMAKRSRSQSASKLSILPRKCSGSGRPLFEGLARSAVACEGATRSGDWIVGSG